METLDTRDSVASVADHYDALLAEHYTWMSGDFAGAVAAQRSLLNSLAISPSGSRQAVDLGSGPGYQSIALAELSFRDLTPDLTGLNRFIPVRSDPDRIMTCFLEYEPETVIVAQR